MRIAFADFSGWDFHAQSVDVMPMGGSQSAACHLARCLAIQGHEVFLITNVSSPGQYDGVTCLSWKQTDAAGLRSLQLNVLVCILAAGNGVKLRELLGPGALLILWNQHAHDQPGIQALKDPRERAAYDAFAMVSDWQREQFQRCFTIEPQRMTVLRNAIGPAFAGLFADGEPILGQKTTPPVLAYTSTPFRGLDLLLDGFPQIRADFPEARLRIFSSMKVYQSSLADDEKAFGALYQRCREMAGVEYVGSLPQPELARELRGAAVLAYPNTFAETSCISVMEALAAGCCVITSRHGALPETGAGFARLIAIEQSRASFLQQFVGETVQVLRQCATQSDAMEHDLRRQVTEANRTCTWPLRARQWAEWLQALKPKSASTGQVVGPSGPSISVLPIRESFDLAVRHHQAGRLAQAETLYRQILDLEPKHTDALHFLGVAAHQLGHHEAAIEWIRQTLTLDPHNADAHSNLGEAYRISGRAQEAIASYRRALQLKPECPAAHNNLGIALAAQGQFDEAGAAYRRAITLRPNYPEAYNNLGGALADGGQLEEAIVAYHRALELKPDLAEACNNLGVALAGLGQIEKALAAYRRALKLRADYPEALNNIGGALKDQGQLDDAEALYRRALAIQPNYADAHNNLGNVLRERGQLDEAIAAYRRALQFDPQGTGAQSNLIYTLHFHPNQDGRLIAEEQRRWNREFGDSLKSTVFSHHNNGDPKRRLRIGYLSPDFRDHPVAFFFVPLVEAHDHEQFEIYCYASVSRPDGMTRHLRQQADVWREVRFLSDGQLAERIRGDGIDILVDLAMHTADNRLRAFVRRPAPVQVSWLGYPGSTGVEAIEYRLSDARIDPVGLEDINPGGQVMRLPDAWCCYAPVAEFSPVGALPAAGGNGVTFGSLNQFAKINEPLLRCWTGLLLALPDARLLIVCPAGHDQERTWRQFAKSGVARERVELIAPVPWTDYIQLGERIDVALDSYPCNGMTTTCHALWMGLPVVTRAGASAVSRASLSLLHTLGLSEWVAQSEEGYVRIGVDLAGDLERLAELRATLRPRMLASPLMDAPRFARNIEAAYRTMWRRWCQEEKAP